jgi:YegS/Rv2252/BmrU family lipid kinase
MAKIKVILNPIAGKGAGSLLKPEIETYLKGLGLEFDLTETEKIGHGIDLAQEAARNKFDILVAAGGDGTVNEIINGLMHSKRKGHRPPALAVLPIGRGNDFAFGMGVPKLWRDAAQALVKAERHALDIGIAKSEYFPDGRYFGNGVGIGFDAVVGFVAAKSKLTGFMSYLVAAIKTIFLYFHAPTIKLELDDQTITQPCLMVSIMNGRRMGGTFMMAPDSKHDDGVFDLCIAGQVSRLGIFALIPHFMKGDQAGHKAVKTVRSRKVIATAVKGTLPAHADGETLCEEGHQVSIELLPAELDIII